MTVGEAQGQLADLIAEAHQGEVIILTDNPELEAELLKAIDGPFSPYSPEEMRSIGERIVKEKLGK